MIEIEVSGNPFAAVWFLVAVGKERAFVIAESECMTEIVRECSYEAEQSLYWNYGDYPAGIYVIEGNYWFRSEANMQGDYDDDEGFFLKNQRLATAQEIADQRPHPRQEAE